MWVCAIFYEGRPRRGDDVASFRLTLGGTKSDPGEARDHAPRARGARRGAAALLWQTPQRRFAVHLREAAIFARELGVQI
jgi:hypothetical protein